jgi:predicted small secreted protein
MIRIATAIALVSLLALTACANTFGGMTKDAKQTGEAIGSSTHRVLKAGS